MIQFDDSSGDIKYYVMKYDEEPLNFWDKVSLWHFFHSTPNGQSSCVYNENTYCLCFNCCPGNLELKIDKIWCKEDKICLLGCFTLMFL